MHTVHSSILVTPELIDKLSHQACPMTIVAECLGTLDPICVVEQHNSAVKVIDN